mmetsp:Transcript_26745/g.58149  ORF Transcript_26745/g.58149 Transcript_26745/m.58149 type:complete len:235 (+) Transcript_26745:71-775(+)|eukprot:CAMPEP_0206424528 /NCGR_PEP_ID=MMETSP0324_2-20121206/3280_1 /ASSEMBLY_ACC=CAM_ASM_000836 /TAXON_ID=2866 /ORGANISM="Crypthecodinium cohnii, Strain Seligo" /LENGTH=234 /DNA_ID=CAMNT_0053889197 /DNA_START=67 /DNA_END=771 /DNA_ORIENTATION=-
MAQDTTSGASSSSNKVPKAKAKSVAETNHVFDKTRLCKFFFRGSCDKMEKCTFAHSPSELLPKPSFYKSQLCVDFQRHKSCPNGDDCNFAHSEEELQTPTKNPRIKSNSGKRLRERRSRRKQVEDAASSLPELTSSSSELPREAFDDRSSDYADKDEFVLQECSSGIISCHISVDNRETYWIFPVDGQTSDKEEEIPTVVLVKNTFLHMEEQSRFEQKRRARSCSQPACVRLER